MGPDGRSVSGRSVCRTCSKDGGHGTPPVAADQEWACEGANLAGRILETHLARLHAWDEMSVLEMS